MNLLFLVNQKHNSYFFLRKKNDLQRIRKQLAIVDGKKQSIKNQLSNTILVFNRIWYLLNVPSQ